MRISDWSSDVCSSDLPGNVLGALWRVEDVLPQVLSQDLGSLSLSGQVELDKLVDTIIYGVVELVGLVRREHNHELARRLTGAVQERIQSVTHVLAHVL